MHLPGEYFHMELGRDTWWSYIRVLSGNCFCSTSKAKHQLPIVCPFICLSGFAFASTICIVGNTSLCINVKGLMQFEKYTIHIRDIEKLPWNAWTLQSILWMALFLWVPIFIDLTKMTHLWDSKCVAKIFPLLNLYRKTAILGELVGWTLHEIH